MGRRLILLMCAMATMVVVAAGVALAVTIRGTNGNDTCGTIAGQPAPSGVADDITLADGNDTCNGGMGPDVIHGDSGADNLNGGPGADFVYGGGGVGDNLVGGGGADFLNVADGDLAAGADDSVSGGTGADICAVDDAAAELADGTCETVIQ